MAFSTGGTSNSTGGSWLPSWGEVGDFFGGFLRKNPVSIGGGSSQVTIGGSGGLTIGEGSLGSQPASDTESAVRDYLDQVKERLRLISAGALQGAANAVNPVPTYLNMGMLVLAAVLLVIAFRRR